MTAYIVHDCEHIGIMQRLQGDFCAAADCPVADLLPQGAKPLTDLPPSIMVDGRMVDLVKVVTTYCEPVTHELPDEAYEGAILQSWLKAARQVAEGEA